MNGERRDQVFLWCISSADRNSSNSSRPGRYKIWYKKEIWLAEIYEKTFVFKHKTNDWMKQTSGSRCRLSQLSHRSSSKSSTKASNSSPSYKLNKFGRSLSKVKVIQEKICASKILAETEFGAKDYSISTWNTRNVFRILWNI